MRQDVRPVGAPAAAHEGAQRREGIRVSDLQTPVLDIKQSGGASAHSLRGKAAQVYSM